MTIVLRSQTWKTKFLKRAVRLLMLKSGYGTHDTTILGPTETSRNHRTLICDVLGIYFHLLLRK